MLFLVSLVACTNNATIDNNNIEAHENGKIYATIDNNGARVQLNSEVQTVWTKGDEITILSPKSYAQYKFDGETGDRSGVFSIKDEFTPISDKALKYYALYPGHGNLDYSGTRATKNEMIATLPSVQHYVKDSYCSKSNVMVGSSDDGSSYVFKNVVSYLRFSFVGERAVKRIQLKGNNSELLAGSLYVNMDNLGIGLKGDEVGNSKTVLLDCGENGVQLSETPTDFYFVLPVVEFSKGFSIVVEFTDGTVFSKIRAKQFRMVRNVVYPMAVLNVDPSDEDKYIYIDHSGARIATPKLFTVIDVPASGSVVWGDGSIMMLGENQDTDYIYKDGEPSHKVSVQTVDANIFQLRHCAGVSRIDLSNF